MENRILAIVYLLLSIPLSIVVLRRLKFSRKSKEFYGRNLAFSFVMASHLLCGIPQLFYVFFDPVETKACMLRRIIFLYFHHLEDFITTSALLFINMFFLKKLHLCIRFKNNPSNFERLERHFVSICAFILTSNGTLALYFTVLFIQDIDGCRTMFPRNIYVFCYSFIFILLINLIICIECLITNSYRLIYIHHSGKFTNLRLHVIILTGINILTMIIYFPYFVLQNNYLFHITGSQAIYWIYRLKNLLLPALYLVFPDLKAICIPWTKGHENGTYLTVVHSTIDEDLSQMCLELSKADVHDSARISAIIKRYKVSRGLYSSNASCQKEKTKHHVYRPDAKHAFDVPEQSRNLCELRRDQGSHSEDDVHEFDFNDMSSTAGEIPENDHIYDEIN